MASSRTSSIPKLSAIMNVSRRSLELSGNARAQIDAFKQTVRRGTNWSALFRRLRATQQQSSLTRTFQRRVHNSSDVVAAGLEALIALASALQLGLTYRAPLWRQNRACAERDKCTIDLSDGSFGLPNAVRLAMLILALTRAWIRVRFLLATRKCVRRPCQREWVGKLVLEVISVALLPFPGVESVVGRHRSGLLLLLTLSVAIRPIFWRQLSYFPYPIRQQEKVASFSGNLEFSYRSFVFKKVMDDTPLLKIVVFMTLLVSFGSYTVHVVETMDGACRWPGALAGESVASSDAECDDMSEADALWLLMTTILPIGFGDVVSRTTVGRALVVLSAIIAVCLNAMFFSIIIRKFSFSSMEARVHSFLYRMELYGKKDLSAVLAVQATYRFHKSYKRSLIWHQQIRSRVLYRPLSARLPNEFKKKLYISRFQASLKDILKYDTDGDPLNAFVKHVEVITAALGTTFMDITWLKKLSSQHPSTPADRRPKPLRAVFRGIAGLVLPRPNTTSTVQTTPVLRYSGVGAAPTALTFEANDANPQATVSLPLQVEEQQRSVATQPASPVRRSSMAAPPPLVPFHGSTDKVPAEWGESMLLRCEQTLALLQRIEADAKDIL